MRIRLLATGMLLCALALAAPAGAQDQGTEKSGIVFALYTVQDGVMKMTAQLYPEASEAGLPKARLEFRDGAQWRTAAESEVVLPGWSAHFRVEGWDASRDVSYRVRYRDSQYGGLVRHDPVEKTAIVAAVFTGNSPGPGGGQISKADVPEYVAKLDPDLLVFTGDQVYNHDRHTEHWITFGEDFGEIIRNRPTICLPDDHDVGHPNLWGAGGRPAKRDFDGGYMKPAEYVNMVQRQQTSHMPDPYDPTPVEQGITVYYTAMNVGGVDFAIIEDRKWKSGCTGLVAEGLGPRPDHIDKPDYDPKDYDLPGLELLGERQYKFLDDWGRDWSGAVMKCVVSQTIFSGASTHHSGDRTFYYADFDSNAWPQTGRNRAVDLMRRCFAFHVCGDQHLSTIVQYGIDEWRDSGWVFCVPSIANLWPRWWDPKVQGRNPEPGAQERTGDFFDGFGNRQTIYAHTNPYTTGREPAVLHDRMPGWGVVTFDKRDRTITMECWPRMVDPTDPDSLQYEGWPRTISQLDNYGRKPAAWLPRLDIGGPADPVVQVVRESDGEVVYTVRIRGNSFRPWVFERGKYTVRVGEGDDVKALTGIESIDDDAEHRMEVAM